MGDHSRAGLAENARWFLIAQPMIKPFQRPLMSATLALLFVLPACASTSKKSAKRAADDAEVAELAGERAPNVRAASVLVIDARKGNVLY